MTEKLNLALTKVQMTYEELVEISNDMLAPITDPINALVSEVNKNINALSIDQVRDFILRLQLKAYEISDIKEKSALKAELAEAVYKEKYATEFNLADGSATVKGNIATINASAETVSEALYNLVSSVLKTKLDQLHRLVSALTTILMSRGQEMKFMNFGVSNDITPTTNGTTSLNKDTF